MNRTAAAAGAAGAGGAVTKKIVAVLAGAMVVALAAQAAIPLPGTPVPLTLQGPAVLIVGALLGPTAGAASMVLYLVLGVAGLPVFAPGGLPGFARLLGPTGGYLLAFPVAAAIVGYAANEGRRIPSGPFGPPFRLALGLVLGLGVIYAGGIAQLAALGGDMGTALRVGSAPFLLVDLVKLVLAGLVIRKTRPAFRALL